MPYDGSQSRTAKEQARTRLPAPTLFRGEDGTDGVPLRLAAGRKPWSSITPLGLKNCAAEDLGALAVLSL